MRTARVLLALVWISAAAIAQQQAAAPSTLQGLDKFADQVREEWNVPGLAVGVVHDGEVVFARGFGYRDAGQKLPVTTKTLFPIGSTSKSFTALALAILKDQGKINWGDRVRRYLPEFQLQDPVASDRMTLRDLLLHRSGLARHDLLWYSSSFSRKQLIERLRYLAMSKDFRDAFQYNNFGYMVAGYVGGKVSGAGWEQMVRQSVLEPLGMTATDFSDAEMQKSPDYSLPYEEVKSTVQRIPFKPVEGIGPAGGINSNLEDMLRYTQMLLAKGKYNGKQIVTETSLRQIQTAQIVMGVPSGYPELAYPAYGMGWVIQTYRGHDYVWHNGGIDGFYTLVALLPKDSLGVVIVSNRLQKGPPEIISRNIFDRFLGLAPIDWNQRLKAGAAKAEKAEAEAEKKTWAERKPGTRPAHALDEYAGTYEDPGYGTVTVTEGGGALQFQLNDLSAALQHFHYDTFIVPDGSGPLSLLKLRFNTSMDGNVESLSIPLEPDVPDVVFNRVPAKSAVPNPGN